MRRLVPSWVKWPQLDLPLLLGLLLLMGFGLLVLYSASGERMDVVYRQATRLGVGLVALLVLSQVPPHIFRIWTPWLYALGILLLLATWLFGVGRGADRWLDCRPVPLPAVRDHEVGGSDDDGLVPAPPAPAPGTCVDPGFLRDPGGSRGADRPCNPTWAPPCWWRSAEVSRCSWPVCSGASLPESLSWAQQQPPHCGW